MFYVELRTVTASGHCSATEALQSATLVVWVKFVAAWAPAKDVNRLFFANRNRTETEPNRKPKPKNEQFFLKNFHSTCDNEYLFVFFLRPIFSHLTNQNGNTENYLY